MMVPTRYKQRLKCALISFLLACFSGLAQSLQSFAFDEKSILGEWRNDAEQETIAIEPNGLVKWTFTWKGYGDTSTCAGRYRIEHSDQLVIEINKKTNTLSISPAELILRRNGKLLKYYRGFPIACGAPDYWRTLIVTCYTSTSPAVVEAAITKLKPIEICIYGPHGGKRTIAVKVEKQIAQKSLQQAQADKTFVSAKLAIAPGTDREDTPGISLPIGSAYDELMIVSRTGGYVHNAGNEGQPLKQALSRLGGMPVESSSDTMRFTNGHIVAAVLTVFTDPKFDGIMPHLASQAENVFIAYTSTKTPPEQVEASLLKLKPSYLNFAKPKDGKQAIGIQTNGPDALSNALSLAREDKSFISVELPDTQKKRAWLWDYSLNPVGNFEPPYNELMIYGTRGVTKEKITDSVKKLGGEVKSSDFMTIVRFNNRHVISGFLKAIADPNLTGVSQNMRMN